MKKVIVCVYVALIVAFTNKTAIADGTPGVLNEEAKVENFISTLYKQIDFGKSQPLSYEVFSKAYRGYLNLRNTGKLNADREILSVCDFSLPSTESRLWIIDLSKKKLVYNTYVAHGQGSGDDYATAFSNKNNSHQSSLGFYVTGETYNGEHGTSLRLDGQDQGFNDAAYDRGIVVHGADYVSDRFINAKDRLGRSWGCPAVPAKISLPIINAIKDGTCLFIYYPQANYLKTAYWLNKKVAALPENNMLGNMPLPGKSKDITVEYIHNGKVDSVKTMRREG
jgi:L,D-transpeptidase catalytic domain